MDILEFKYKKVYTLLRVVSVFFLLSLFSCSKSESVREFDYLGETVLVNLHKNKSLYNLFKEEDRAVYYYEDNKPDDTEEIYYKRLLFDDRDEAELRQFLSELLVQEADYIDKLELLVAYIQSALPYDMKAFKSKKATTKFPYETYYLGKGVCGDKSILLGKCLSLLNYDFALFIFDKANHMAVGIKVPPGYGNYGTDYAFIETTGKNPIGYVPETFVNDIVLESNPKILTYQGDKMLTSFPQIQSRYVELQQKYGEDILYFSANRYRLHIELFEKKGELDILDAAFTPYEGQTLDEEDYDKADVILKELNAVVKEYNRLVKRYNRAK